MPIINEIDKENFQENKTIDINTGVNLKYIGTNGWASVATFIVADGDTKIYIDALFSNAIDEERESNTHSYSLSISGFEGKAKRTHYAELIRKLFIVHGWQYRIEERRFGYKQAVNLNIKAEALVTLKKWESDYVE